jgi:hypothetical protein
MDFAKEWLGLFSLLIVVGKFVWDAFQSPGAKVAAEVAALRKAVNDDIHKLDAKVLAVDAAADQRLDAVEARTAKLEGELKHLPDKDAVNDLRLAIAELKGTVGRLDSTVTTVGRTVDRIDAYLREKA